MAMNRGSNPDPGPRDTRGAEDQPDLDTSVVDEAASALRAYTDHSWSDASRRILGNVLTATRRSRPVRARGADGPFRVSDQVLTARLQEAIDAVGGVEATHIDLGLDDGSLVAVRVGVSVDYPERIHPLGAAVRAAVHTGVRAVLGGADPPSLRDIDVHVRDVNAPD